MVVIIILHFVQSNVPMMDLMECSEFQAEIPASLVSPRPIVLEAVLRRKNAPVTVLTLVLVRE
jgi:hypothetical protein